MTPKEYLHGKKVLVAGLGIFGGGESTAKWLLRQGAKVTVTDLKSEKELSLTLKNFTPKQKKQITFVLGRHRKSDFKKADIVVVNPGMPSESEYLKVAGEHGARLENVASLFFRFLSNQGIGITGTRGKSTTTSFVAELLGKKYPHTKPIGSSETPLLRALEKLGKNKQTPAVVELSSWQLELLPESRRAPHIALITNLYRDHQDRYKNLKAYASAKANIFQHQKKGDFFVLNDENEWIEFFLKKKPKGKVYYFSTKPLPKKKEGVFLSSAGIIRIRINDKEKKMFGIREFEKKYGKHNVENFLASVLLVRLMDPSISITKKDALALEEVGGRQEIVSHRKNLKVINDTTATSPEATVVAVTRFSTKKKDDLVLITGGTDKDLDYTKLAKVIKKKVSEKNLILLEGSATKKLVRALAVLSYFTKDPPIRETLDECVSLGWERVGRKKTKILLFSPGSASFEKFNNEFHRGECFRKLIKKS